MARSESNIKLFVGDLPFFSGRHDTERDWRTDWLILLVQQISFTLHDYNSFSEKVTLVVSNWQSELSVIKNEMEFFLEPL